MNIATLRSQLQSGDITAAGLLQKLADEIAARDPLTGAYLSHDLETALREAEQADLSLPLGGIPVAIKDNICVRGQPCSCASRFLAGSFTSPYDATVVRKLRQAGAIPFGRMNMDEFAMGSATENSAIQQTRNPHDPQRIPGGSSGGSAAAVADRTAVVALGSDTGGSIRQPASHCGVVGLKPSYGRVSRYGLVAFASSLDQIGPLSSCVEDAARIFSVIAGPDPLDSTCLEEPVADVLTDLDRGVDGMRIGMPKEYFREGMDSGVRSRVEETMAKLASRGAEIIPVSLPYMEYAVPTYYVLAPAEASSNLARFDGIRYGRRTPRAADIPELYRRSREEGFGAEVKRRILLGTFVLSSGYYDATYGRAQKVRTLIRRDFAEAFRNVDVIASPVAPTPARRIHAFADDPMHEYLSDIFTISANLAGIPGISVPCGVTDFDGGTGLPVGFQVLGPALGEAAVLRVAAEVERIG